MCSMQQQMYRIVTFVHQDAIIWNNMSPTSQALVALVSKSFMDTFLITEFVRAKSLPISTILHPKSIACTQRVSRDGLLLWLVAYSILPMACVVYVVSI